MAQKRDYYDVLGIERSATEQEIAGAYRKLAMKHHPDRNPGDEEAVERFKEAAEAFEVLSDSEKRARYDRYGHAGIDGMAGGAPHFRDVGDIFEAFGDIFGDSLFGGMFGSRSRGRRSSRGADVKCHVTLDLHEAARGHQDGPVSTPRNLPILQRVRALPGSRPEQCNYCGGRGQVIQSTGIFLPANPLLVLPRTRQHHPPALRRVPRSGLTVKTVEREVRIPAGVDTNTRLRLHNEGEASPNAPGAATATASSRSPSIPCFTATENLVCQVPISYAQAALGATIEVPTLEGRHELAIPAGTPSGEVFRVRGQGMPHPRYRGKGDLLVQVYIEVPKHLSPEHESLLRTLAELENNNVSPERKSFFKKLKEYFQSGLGDYLR